MNRRVEAGDTLSGIAVREGVTLGELLKANPQLSQDGRSPDLIYPGEEIAIPPPKFDASKNLKAGVMRCGLDPAGEDKKARLARRRKLIEDARKEADDLAASEDPADQAAAAKLRQAADRLELNNGAVERARLAANVYGDGKPPEGWKDVSKDDPRLAAQTWEDKKTGFKARLYQSDFDNSVVLVYAGTEPKSWADWVNNFRQGLGYDAPQYQQAVRLAQAVDDVYGGQFEVAGHSLGGGLASTVAAATGVKGTTFNAAGVHDKTLRRFGVDPAAPSPPLNIDTFSVTGEVLTSLQENVALAPDALGRMHRLPVHNQARYLPPVPLLPPTAKKLIDAYNQSQRLIEQVRRHSMDVVIAGLEEQKEEDISTICRL